MKKKSYKDTALATMRGMHILSAFNFWWNEVVGVSEAIRVTNRKLRCAQRPTAFENSRLTWVSVQDVVLNTLKDRPRNQVKHSQSSATFTKHTSTERCLLMSLWFLLVCHALTQNDAESPVSIFLLTFTKKIKNTCPHKKSLHQDMVCLFK